MKSLAISQKFNLLESKHAQTRFKLKQRKYDPDRVKKARFANMKPVVDKTYKKEINGKMYQCTKLVKYDSISGETKSFTVRKAI